MYKAVFLDLDDTLLDSNKNISEENQEAIRYVKEKGGQVFIASGRSIEVTKKYRGKGKAVRLQYANEQLGNYKNIDFSAAFIYHSGIEKSELSEIEKLLKNAGFKQVITAFTGCMISLHSAPNALGIHFIAD